MELFKRADEKIMLGYQFVSKRESDSACDVWLEAWQKIKSLMESTGARDIEELQNKYKWSEFLSNYVQDLEGELFNAGGKNKQYFTKRIEYCNEMLSFLREEDTLTIENTRRAIADSHYELGNEEECARLYGTWLKSDPSWGWGHIGWSDCYLLDANRTEMHLKKSAAIITRALAQEKLRDRIDVVERAIEINQLLGNEASVAELEKEMKKLSKNAFYRTPVNASLKIEKVGRNEPCTCGSGKKYKKCCGK